MFPKRLQKIPPDSIVKLEHSHNSSRKSKSILPRFPLMLTAQYLITNSSILGLQNNFFYKFLLSDELKMSFPRTSLHNQQIHKLLSSFLFFILSHYLKRFRPLIQNQSFLQVSELNSHYPVIFHHLVQLKREFAPRFLTTPSDMVVFA